MNIQGWMNVVQVMGAWDDSSFLGAECEILYMQSFGNEVNKVIKSWYWSYSQCTHAFAHLN